MAWAGSYQGRARSGPGEPRRPFPWEANPWPGCYHDPSPIPNPFSRSHDISKIFIGNLSFDTTQQELAEFLAPAGTVVEVIIPSDRATGKPRGFAFAQFETDEEAAKGIELAEGGELGGRTLRANPAEARPPRPGFQGGRDRGQAGGRGQGKGGKGKGSRRGLRSKKRSL